MDLLTIVSAVLSRWFVVVPVLALTAYGAFLAAGQAEVEYTAAGSVLLVNPGGADGDPTTTETGTDVNVSGSVIAHIVQSDQTRLALSERGADAPYTVEAERDGTILRVTSTADAAEGVAETVSAVLDQIAVALEERQNAAGIAAEQHIAVETLVEPVEATSQTVRDEATGALVTRWSASGVVLLAGPPPGPSNPLDASRYLANILEEQVHDGRLREAILDSETIREYSVSEDRTNAAPILYLSVTGTQAGDVMRTYDRLIGILETRLADGQETAGAPEETWVRLRPLSTPVQPETDTRGALRPALTIIALGVAAAASLAVLVDGLLASRRRAANGRKRSRDPVLDLRDVPSSPATPQVETQSPRHRERTDA